jgi:hypothetical protein
MDAHTHWLLVGLGREIALEAYASGSLCQTRQWSEEDLWFADGLVGETKHSDAAILAALDCGWLQMWASLITVTRLVQHRAA